MEKKTLFWGLSCNWLKWLCRHQRNHWRRCHILNVRFLSLEISWVWLESASTMKKVSDWSICAIPVNDTPCYPRMQDFSSQQFTHYKASESNFLKFFGEKKDRFTVLRPTARSILARTISNLKLSFSKTSRFEYMTASQAYSN